MVLEITFYVYRSKLYMHFKEIVLKTILTTTYFHCILNLKLCLNREDRLCVVNISDHLLITLLKATADKYGNNSVIFLTIKGIKDKSIHNWPIFLPMAQQGLV